MRVSRSHGPASRIFASLYCIILPSFWAFQKQHQKYLHKIRKKMNGRYTWHLSQQTTESVCYSYDMIPICHYMCAVLASALLLLIHIPFWFGVWYSWYKRWSHWWGVGRLLFCLLSFCLSILCAGIWAGASDFVYRTYLYTSSFLLQYLRGVLVLGVHVVAVCVPGTINRQ